MVQPAVDAEVAGGGLHSEVVFAGDAGQLDERALADLGRAVSGIGGQIMVIVAACPSPLPAAPLPATARRAVLRPAARPARRASLERRRDHWVVTVDGISSVVAHRKGLVHLATLVGRPDQEVHALELAGCTGALVVAPGIETVDGRALAAYRRRAAELAEDLAEAERNNDIDAASRHRASLDAIADAVSAAVGLGGRTRRVHDAAERARLNVTRSLRAAIATIAAADPVVGRHLDTAVRTGTYCCYRSDPGSSLRWDVAT